METEFYKDAKLKYRWRVTADNGEIIGASSESFSCLDDCTANLRLLVESQPKVPPPFVAIEPPDHLLTWKAVALWVAAGGFVGALVGAWLAS